MLQTKIILIIMDGWGIGKVPSSDAIKNAKTPYVDSLYASYPNSTLITCGEDVGLPQGQMGNSEVGHLNIGAGRIVYQDLERINVAIRDQSFQTNPFLMQAIGHAKEKNKTLHLIGLVSDGGVHSHINHVKEILTVCKKQDCTNVLVHAFTDGRDTDPKSGLGFIKELQEHMDKTTGAIATVTGRYYSMDRDKRWERVRVVYDALVYGKGNGSNDIISAIETSYQKGITDEFIEPIIHSKVYKQIETGDIVICFNFRTDRCREITEVLTQHDVPEQGMHTLDIDYFTMTQYDHTYKNVTPFFVKDDLNNTLGEVLAKNNKTQLRIAETEKYPHVSFFFSGGREFPFEGEKRLMVPSPKVATYDLKPEMSAYELSDQVIAEMQNEPDFICLNFANADMVGHTGVWNAVIRAVETVDSCVEKVIQAAQKKGYSIFLTADHGNADYEINEDGTPNTAHTLNLVPFFIIKEGFKQPLKNGKLADIAPTILTMMAIPLPPEMTGNILFD